MGIIIIPILQLIFRGLRNLQVGELVFETNLVNILNHYTINCSSVKPKPRFCIILARVKVKVSFNKNEKQNINFKLSFFFPFSSSFIEI